MTEQLKRKGGRPLKGAGNRRSLTTRLGTDTWEWLEWMARDGAPLTDIVENALRGEGVIMERIHPPFTAAQVAALNRRQMDGRSHAFTCANRGDGAHVGEGLLTATTAGWVCPACDHTQGWAWAFQAESACRS